MKAKRVAKFSDEKKVRASFANYIVNNEIDRNKLVDALNACEFICDGKGKKITLSIDELDKALADIDNGIEDSYKILRRQDLGNILEVYSVPKNTTSGTPLSDMQILIYESLILLFQEEFTAHPEIKDKDMRLKTLYLERNVTDEMQKLQHEIQHEIQSLTTQATTLFAEKLHKTDAKIRVAHELRKTDTKIQKTVFTKIYDFFNTPSFARDIVIGTGIGLLIAGTIAGAILASVGTAGIGPLVFGAAAAASLGAVGTGLSLGAIGLGIVGFFTASAALVGKFFRYETTDNMDKQIVTKVLPPETFKKQFAGIMNKNPAPVSSQTINTPELIKKEPVLQPKPSKKFEMMYQRLYKAWEEQTTVLIIYLNRLEGKIKNNFKDFRLMRYQLLKDLQKDIFSTENFNKNFKGFEDFIKENQEYVRDEDVIKIFETHKELVAIRNEYHANKPKLDKLRESRVAKQEASAAQEIARREFNAWLMTTSQVSKQRIIELYPEEKEQNAMYRKCASLGVSVFDSSNAEERQNALTEYHAYKLAESVQATFR